MIHNAGGYAVLAHPISLEKTYDLQIEEIDEDLRIEVSMAEGEKCERCWMYSKTVGEDKENPCLCHRCSEAIK